MINTLTWEGQTGGAALADPIANESSLPRERPALPQRQEAEEAEAALQIVLAYANRAAFRAAMGVYRAVARSLPLPVEFRGSWWRFEAFAKPALMEHAVRVAAEADLIFCCASDPHALPPAVQDWICLWTARRDGRDGALAALVPAVVGNLSPPAPVEMYLREAAHASGLEFFATRYATGVAALDPPHEQNVP